PVGDVGVFGSNDNLIGGTQPGARNIIVGGSVAVGASGIATNPAHNVLQGNYIGTDRTGEVALGGTGVQVGGVGNIIGGTAPGAGNLISGNRNYGIIVFGA